MSASARDPEGVYTFGEFTERAWTVYMMWFDFIVGLCEDLKRDFQKILQGLKEFLDDDKEEVLLAMQRMDRVYHRAA